MINRRDALKAIAGTALIPVIGVPTVAAPVVPSGWTHVVVTVFMPNHEGPYSSCESMMSNSAYRNPIMAAFTSAVIWHYEASQIVIRVNRSEFELVYTRDEHTIPLDESTWLLKSRKAKT